MIDINKQLLVKYKDEIDRISFGTLTAKGQDLFFAVCAKAKDKGAVTLRFTIDELKKIARYHRTDNLSIIENDVIRLSRDLCRIGISVDDESMAGYLCLFTGFVYDKNDKVLTVKINEVFEYLLNHWNEGGHTKFRLSDFTNIRSKYSKTIFRYLNKYNVNKYWYVTIDDFRYALKIPASYTNKNIQARIINPAIEELSVFFTGLKCTAQHAPKRGAPIVAFIFSYTGFTNPILTSYKKDEKKQYTKKEKIHNFDERDNSEIFKKLDAQAVNVQSNEDEPLPGQMTLEELPNPFIAHNEKSEVSEKWNPDELPFPPEEEEKNVSVQEQQNESKSETNASSFSETDSEKRKSFFNFLK